MLTATLTVTVKMVRRFSGTLLVMQVVVERPLLAVQPVRHIP